MCTVNKRTRDVPVSKHSSTFTFLKIYIKPATIISNTALSGQSGLPPCFKLISKTIWKPMHFTPRLMFLCFYYTGVHKTALTQKPSNASHCDASHCDALQTSPSRKCDGKLCLFLSGSDSRQHSLVGSMAGAWRFRQHRIWRHKGDACRMSVMGFNQCRNIVHLEIVANILQPNTTTRKTRLSGSISGSSPMWRTWNIYTWPLYGFQHTLVIHSCLFAQRTLSQICSLQVCFNSQKKTAYFRKPMQCLR